MINAIVCDNKFFGLGKDFCKNLGKSIISLYSIYSLIMIYSFNLFITHTFVTLLLFCFDTIPKRLRKAIQKSQLTIT